MSDDDQSILSLDYATPGRFRGRNAWRDWYGRGKPGSAAGCFAMFAGLQGLICCLMGAVAGAGFSGGAIGVVPFGFAGLIAAIFALSERETDKFFPLAGIASIAFDVLLVIVW
jgi:hypothetical protein